MEQWKVTKAESGMRLLDFLRTKCTQNSSARHLKRSIEAGNSLINGKVERFASKAVGSGDLIAFHSEHEAPSTNQKASFNFEKTRVLYADGALLVYNKPAGVASDNPHLTTSIQSHYPTAKLVHRLDRDTTGALVFALTTLAYDALILLFRLRKVQKTYYALVEGVPLHPSGRVENYLGKLNVYQGQTLWGAVNAAKGSVAITRWEVKTRGTGASLIVCYPETGRTHQIRVHLSGLGHPILGDHQYGKLFKCLYRPARMMLHAYEVAFEHPVTHHELRVSAPLPPDFTNAAEQVLTRPQRST